MEENTLYILWTNNNPVTAELMVFMYSYNAKKAGWWDNVTIIIWGAASLLAAEDQAVGKRLSEIISSGIRVVACRSCADQLGVTERLEETGVEVFYTGELMTDILKNKKPLLTV